MNKFISVLSKINVIILLILFAPTIFAAETPKLIKPSHLQPGDTVALISSAFRVPEDQEIQFATERMQALGLKVKYGKYIFNRDGYFAGTDADRAADINTMFKDPTVKAIIELRGGWGSNRILPYIDYQAIKQHPKIIMGFSDITSLLLAIHAKTGLVTFHGPLAIEPWPAFTVQYVKSILFNGEKTVLQNPAEPEDDLIQTQNRIQTITPGKATGPLLGGNLTVLTSMLGSKYLPNFKGAILFVEDVDENVYQVDRMLTQLQLAGVLNHIAGFIFGQCTQCTVGDGTTNYGSLTLMQVLKQHIQPLHIPAYYGAMIGHDPKNFTLPEGSQVQMDADKGTITLLAPAVS
jgi:muramoyltetrapeptide carboxypeptidase